MDINRVKLDVAVGRKTGEKIWKAFSEKYQPLILGVQNALRERVGLDKTNGSSFYNEELFLTETGQIIYYRIREDYSRIEIGSLVSNEEESEAFNDFKSTVANIVKGKKAAIGPWTPIIEKNPVYEMIKEDSHVLEPQTKEMEASTLMKEDRLRELLKKITDKGTCFQEELVTGPDDYATPQLINTLEALGLISKEFFVFCLESGQQISRVSSLQALQESRAHGFKCFSCGRLISEERISPRLKASPLGERFSQSNYWLALYLAYTLENLGINVDAIYFNTEKESSVFDLFLKIFDGYVMFEVKDKPVHLEDVFLFLSRVDYYQPFRAILLSSHKVPLEVKLYLKNYKQHPVTLVEGFDNLEMSIKESLQQKKELYIEKIFANFTSSTEIKLDTLMLEKLYGTSIPVTEEETEEEIDTGKPEVVAVEEPVETQTTEELTAVAPVEQPIAATEVEPVLDIEDQTPTVEVEMVEAVVEVPVFADVVEEAAVEEVFEEIPEPAEVPDYPEKPVVEEPEERVRSLQIDSEYSMEFDEAIPTEIIDEEISTALDASEQELERAVNYILDFVTGEGIPGNINRIETEMAYLQEVNFYNVALINKEGLLVSSTIGELLDTDAVSAYSTSIFDSILHLLRESGLGDVKSLHLEGTTGRLKIYSAEIGYLAAYEEKKPSEQEDDGSLPGETSLREAILHKVLEDLGKNEGVKGSIIAGRDGLLIDKFNPNREFDPDTMGYVSGQVLNENEKYMNQLGIGPVSHMLIKTKSSYFTMSPIAQEAVLTASLEPQVSRDVWTSHLPQAAQVIKSVL